MGWEMTKSERDEQIKINYYGIAAGGRSYMYVRVRRRELKKHCNAIDNIAQSRSGMRFNNHSQSLNLFHL